MSIDERSDQVHALLSEPMTADALSAAMGVGDNYVRRILRRMQQQRRVRPVGTVRQRGSQGLRAMRWGRWTG